MKTVRVLTCTTLFALTAATTSVSAIELTPKEQLGKSIFFDMHLSINQNQSCASCHDPEWGWTGPASAINAAGSVYEGSIPGRFGDRKPPTSAYATPSPILFNDKGTFTGGNFWDGRATGENLGNPAADQALGPFLNPVEQALRDSACVVHRVCNPLIPGDYPVAFEDVWGAGACDIDWPVDIADACAVEGGPFDDEYFDPADRVKSDKAYGNIGLSIAAYEDSMEVNAFSSKYDQTFGGKVKLSKQEQRGFALFRGKGQCHRCHISNGQQALFTDYTFDNLGVPKNPENPVYDIDPDFVDLGLGGFLETREDYADLAAENYGKQKVPTLRNVDLRPDAGSVKAYAHNGYFKTLEGIVNFYNTRDVKPECPGLYTEAQALAADCWPAPEVAKNVNSDELGDLGLTDEEEEAIVAFLKTLSDGFAP